MNTKRLLYNCSEGKENIPTGVTYIGRKSKYGNNFIIGIHGTREECIEKFKKDLKERIQSGEITLEFLADLYNKPLLCHCYPDPCHGEVWIAGSRWAYQRLTGKEP